MKKRLFIFFVSLLLSPSLLLAAPKIATFDFIKVIDAHQGRKDEVATFESEREKLAQNPRKKALDEMAAKIQELREKAQGLREGTEEYTRLIQEGDEALESYRDLQNKWSQYATEQSKVIVGSLVDASEEFAANIQKIASEIGESQGFDWVLETSGWTNSKIPVVLYVRNSTDITDLIIEELAKTNPPEE